MAMSDAEVMARIAPAPRPASYGGRIKPDFAHLHAELKRPNVTLMLLWQEYSAANAGGLTYRYSQFADLYRDYVATLRRSMRQVHRAGEKLFVDYAGQSIGTDARATERRSSSPPSAPRITPLPAPPPISGWSTGPARWCGRWNTSTA